MPENEDKDFQLDLTDPKVKAAVDAIVASNTEGLRSNKEEILREKRSVAEKLEKLEKQWEGLEPQKVRTLISTFEKSEEAKLISEGKMEEVLNKRTEAMRNDADTKVRAAAQKVDELSQTIGSLNGKIAELVIDASVREAALTLKVLPSAVKDIVLNARQVFKLTADYKPEARDANGTLRMGKNGKDSLTPAEWLEAQKLDSPHWWGPSAGGGAGGGVGARSSDGQLSDEQLSKMTPSQKMSLAMRGDG